MMTQVWERFYVLKHTDILQYSIEKKKKKPKIKIHTFLGNDDPGVGKVLCAKAY
jgi:hypothetical protein